MGVRPPSHSYHDAIPAELRDHGGSVDSTVINADEHYHGT